MPDTGAANTSKAWIALIIELESQCSDLRCRLEDSNARLRAASVEVESLSSRYLYLKQTVEELEKTQQTLIKRETILLNEREATMSSFGVLQMELKAIQNNFNCCGQGNKYNEDMQLAHNAPGLSYGKARYCSNDKNDVINSIESIAGPLQSSFAPIARLDNKFATVPKRTRICLNDTSVAPNILQGSPEFGIARPKRSAKEQMALYILKYKKKKLV